MNIFEIVLIAALIVWCIMFIVMAVSESVSDEDDYTDCEV